MVDNIRRNRAYGLSNALQKLNSLPIIARRIPNNNDKSFPIGTIWINQLTNDIWMLTSVSAGIPNWEAIGQPEGGEAPISKYIVDSDGSSGYSTIQSALDAANTAGIPATVYVRPGTYAENLTLYPRIDIVGATVLGEHDSVVINGNHTLPDGNFAIRQVQLNSTGDTFSSVVASTGELVFIEIEVNVTSGYFLNVPNWTGLIQLLTVISLFGSDNGGVFNTGGAIVGAFNSGFGKDLTTPMVLSGISIFNKVNFDCPLELRSNAIFQNDSSTYDAPITFLNNSSGYIDSARITYNGGPAITQSSTGNIAITNTNINSTNDPVIDGAGTGTVSFGNITYQNNSTIASTITQAYTRATNRLSPYIVGSTGNFVTIQAALDAANSSGVAQTVYIQPGTYTEDLTLYDDIAISGTTAEEVTITGTHTPPLSGSISIRNCTLADDSFILNSIGAGTTSILIQDCFVNVANGTALNLLNWTGDITIDDCGWIGTNDGGITNSAGASPIKITDSTVGAGTGTFQPSGNTELYNVNVNCDTQILIGSNFVAEGGCVFNGNIQTLGTSVLVMRNSSIISGASAAISHSSTGTILLSNVTIDSTAGTVITGGSGLGTITLSSISFLNDTGIAGTLTLSVIPKTLTAGLISVEGTNATSGASNLVAGTRTVNTTAVTANSRIILTNNAPGGTPGFLHVSARVAGTSFTITSSNAADVSLIAWVIINPAL